MSAAAVKKTARRMAAEVLKKAVLVPPGPASWHGRPVVEWDAAGRPLVCKKVPGLGTPSDQVAGMMVAGSIVRSGDSLFRVESANLSRAVARCLLGRRKGDVDYWSSSSAGHQLVSEEEFGRLQAEADQARAQRAAERDERSCERCWEDDGGRTVDGVDRGRDPRCPDHRPEGPPPPAFAIRARAPRAAESSEIVARILAERAKGTTWRKIEELLGWPDEKGNRAFRAARKGAAK